MIDTLELLKVSVMVGLGFLLIYMINGDSKTKKHHKKGK